MASAKVIVSLVSLRV